METSAAETNDTGAAPDVVGTIEHAAGEVVTKVPPAAVDAAGIAMTTQVNYALLFVGLGVVVLVAFIVWYFTQDRDTTAVAS